MLTLDSFFELNKVPLQYEDIVIDKPIDNATFDINATNVNNTDCWVQNINNTGNVVKEWTKVRDINSNVIYNNLAQGERDVFSVKTRKDNAISAIVSRFYIWKHTSRYNKSLV